MKNEGFEPNGVEYEPSGVFWIFHQLQVGLEHHAVQGRRCLSHLSARCSPAAPRLRCPHRLGEAARQASSLHDKPWHDWEETHLPTKFGRPLQAAALWHYPIPSYAGVGTTESARTNCTTKGERDKGRRTPLRRPLSCTPQNLIAAVAMQPTPGSPHSRNLHGEHTTCQSSKTPTPAKPRKRSKLPLRRRNPSASILLISSAPSTH